MRSTVREVLSTSVLPTKARRRVARSFHSLSRRDGGAEEEPPGHFQRGTILRKGRSQSTIAPNDFISKTSMARGLSPKIGSAAVCSHRNEVRTATE